jgi:hypothetical protein
LSGCLSCTIDADYTHATTNGFRIAPPVQALGLYTTHEPDGSRVRAAWQQLAEQVSYETLKARYARLLAIDTSVLEQVFQVGGSSVPRLVRLGFFVGAIERVERNSVIQDRENIIAVLRNFQGVSSTTQDNQIKLIARMSHQALSACASSWRQHGVIGSNMMFLIHDFIVNGNRVKGYRSPFEMIPIREWRDVLVFCGGAGSQPPLVYHKHTDVAGSIHTFLRLVSVRTELI